MEFNLALNTIIYITIFIVPGILFRSFFYRNEFSKEFYFGNLFERFIWTLFFSVLMLLACYGFFFVILEYFDYDLIPEVSYDTIKDIHSSLHNKKEDVSLPSKETFKTQAPDILFLVATLYGISIFLGVVSHQVAIWSNFNFYNYWHSLMKGKQEKAEPNMVYDRTIADVLTNVQGENVLYRGEIKRHYLSKNDTNLETIVLQEVYKKTSKNKFERIPGHNFCIHKDNIQNMNLSYVFVRKKWIFRGYQNIINVCYLISTFALLASLYIYDSDLVFLNNWAKKIFFFLSGFIILTFFFGSLSRKEIPNKNSYTPLSLIAGLMVWIYLNKSFWWYVLFFILVILLRSLFYTGETKQNKS